MVSTKSNAVPNGSGVLCAAMPSVITTMLLAGQDQLVGNTFFETWNLANIDPNDLQA